MLDDRTDPLADLVVTTLSKCLQNEASITALKRFIAQGALATPDSLRDQILSQIASMEKMAHSEILSALEKANPTVAAMLDRRRIQELPEAQ
jgi:hypothetical protein